MWVTHWTGQLDAPGMSGFDGVHSVPLADPLLITFLISNQFRNKGAISVGLFRRVSYWTPWKLPELGTLAMPEGFQGGVVVVAAVVAGVAVAVAAAVVAGGVVVVVVVVVAAGGGGGGVVVVIMRSIPSQTSLK